ncbi:GAF and ANTAR domain-containing protein [Streptomyces sp. CC224B]|uniref:GAF and ANTAR domain-containing protein n=1 Tax=Streptomyces sp. CC224B TaxID=3044571 RepID=UPI0024A9867D|nr:GAF and ANTAR domain-containing protein [Streptomyces sp. CC224B]
MSVQEVLGGLGEAVGKEQHRVWSARCARVLGLDGIAVSMRSGSELVWFSDDTSAWLEDVQFTLGQGPGVTADFVDVPCQVVDLRADERWPQFAAEAGTMGVRAVFVWPVRSGLARLGTLSGYRTQPGGLTRLQAADGLRVADALAGRLLAWRPDSDASGDGPGTAGMIELHRAEVHQATGVLSYRLGIAPDEALARLRAQAFAAGQDLADAAHDILRELPS